MAGYEGELETGSDRSTGELCADRLHTADDRGAGTVQERWIRDDNGICQSGIWTERFDDLEIHEHQPKIQHRRLFGPPAARIRTNGEQQALRDAFPAGCRLRNGSAGDAKGGYSGIKTFQQGGAGAGSRGFAGKIGVEVFEANAAIAKELEQSEAYADGEAEKMVEIVNPAGVKTFRAGLYYMAMYENDIQIKQFGQQPQKMSWAEFFTIAKKIFESAEWKQRIQEEHSKTEPQEKVETKPIAPAQIKKPESPVNTEAEPVSETPKKSEKETSQNAAQKKNETEQLEEPRKPEEKMQSETEIAENGAESTQNATETAQTETEEQLPGQMNLPVDYPGTESIEVVGKTMPRKDYFDTLTAWGLSVYLSKYLPADILADQKKLYQWMQKLVDERGYEFEQEGGTDA